MCTPIGGYENGGGGGVSGCRVGANDCVFHGMAQAFVVVFWVGDIRAVRGVWCVAAAG
jgi:hypothetical protein